MISKKKYVELTEDMRLSLENYKRSNNLILNKNNELFNENKILKNEREENKIMEELNWLVIEESLRTGRKSYLGFEKLGELKTNLYERYDDLECIIKDKVYISKYDEILIKIEVCENDTDRNI